MLGCHSKSVSSEELQSYVLDEDNGLQKSVESSGTKVTVTYRPTDLWVQQEIEGKIVKAPTVDSLRRKYSRYYYFIVSLSRDNKEALHQVRTMGHYSDLVQTMSFAMSQFVNLTTTKQDTIIVSDSMLNRTYGLGSSTDLLLVFERVKAEDDDWVQLNLSEFGLGLGNQRFRFASKDFERLPSLDFSVAN